MKIGPLSPCHSFLPNRLLVVFLCFSVFFGGGGGGGFLKVFCFGFCLVLWLLLRAWIASNHFFWRHFSKTNPLRIRSAARENMRISTCRFKRLGHSLGTHVELW